MMAVVIMVYANIVGLNACKIVKEIGLRLRKNKNMNKENLNDTICQRYKEIIDAFLGKINQNKMLLNNPDILDIYLKIKDLLD